MLLHSIASMNATDQQQQSSPVSVLDTSFYESPSPVLKRTIDFKEETWKQLISESCSGEIDELVYISEIVKSSQYLPGDSDTFSLLEKQQYVKGKDTSKVSRLERNLIFDTITEIPERDRQLLPWKSLSSLAKPTLQRIWSEFQRMRECDNSALGGENDLVETICGVLKKDLAGGGWGECPVVQQSKTVLEMERMIFRDMVGEIIRDLG